MSELRFENAAATTYEQIMGILSKQLASEVLRIVRLAPRQRVLDIASGTGLVAEAAAALVGPSGHVTATDISPAMIEQARRNLGSLGNVSFGIEDAQSLTFPDRSFDAVTCGLGMMFFPDPAQAVAEFHRVLRPGGYAAISAHRNASRTLVLRVLAAIDRHVQPPKTPSGPVTFDGHEPRLRVLFETAGFRDVETATEVRTFPYPSFDAYFSAIELGAGLVGQEYIAQPESVRTAVREDVRRGLDDEGGPVQVSVEITYASGRR
jgi:ubiquinone/menaquinone biosynthesis C-methylase UbiE